MGRPKRNASQAGLDTATAATPVAKKGRGSSNRTVIETAATTRPRRSSASNGDIGAHVTPKKRGRPPKAASAAREPAKSQKPVAQKTVKNRILSNGSDTPAKAAVAASAAQIPEVGARKVGRKSKASKRASKVSKSNETTTQERRGSDFSVEVASSKAAQAADKQDDEDEDEEGTSYWLMKAEPESRVEKGRDVKFSIDDLKNATEPEGWDARNNMRAMRKGDLAFFYHSNTKVPGIAGVMEIVREHSVDDTAFDPGHPYYDPKSNPEKPKWDVVHVEYRQKFDSLIRLKDLQKFSKPGGVLEGMQTLKQSRLSVSKVTKKEWDFIMSLAEVDVEAQALAQVPLEHDSHEEKEMETTQALSATDNNATDNNTTSATNADNNQTTVNTNGFLPDDVREEDVAAEEEITTQRGSTVENKTTDDSLQAKTENEDAGRGGRKWRR